MRGDAELQHARALGQPSGAQFSFSSPCAVRAIARGQRWRCAVATWRHRYAKSMVTGGMVHSNITSTRSAPARPARSRGTRLSCRATGTAAPRRAKQETEKEKEVRAKRVPAQGNLAQSPAARGSVPPGASARAKVCCASPPPVLTPRCRVHPPAVQQQGPELGRAFPGHASGTAPPSLPCATRALLRDF